MSQKTEDLDRICETLDKLTLDALFLIEEEIRLKLNVEDAMKGGESHLAKARYIMGHKNVSSLQLPTEFSPEITAMTKVTSSEDEKSFGEKTFELHQIKKSDDNNVQDPKNWFGFLVPQNINHAQNMFKQALQWAVQAVNVQGQLRETVTKIHQLKQLKKNIVS